MNKFNEVKINITKALITYVSAELREDNTVDVTIKGWLLTEQGKRVSEFWFNNGKWITDEKKVEIPASVHYQIGEIFKAMTPVVYEKLNDNFKQLPAKTKKKEEVINPEDIPF